MTTFKVLINIMCDSTAEINSSKSEH